MTARTLFDRVEVVRWSDADVPTRGENSIWRASVSVATGDAECINHSTRVAAMSGIVDELRGLPDQRVLVGFDIPFGFPADYARRLVKAGANWRSVWAAVDAEVHDGPQNDDDRYAAADRLNMRAGMSPGPFWGCPSDRAIGSVRSSRPATFAGLAPRRLTVQRLEERNHTIGSVWKLHGDAAAGAACLLGLPHVRRLVEHRDLARRIRVWPFDTGCTPMPTMGGSSAIVVCELWPHVFDVDQTAHSLPEAAQVIGVGRALARLDRDNELGRLFAPFLTADETKIVEREEGWVLGA